MLTILQRNNMLNFRSILLEVILCNRTSDYYDELLYNSARASTTLNVHDSMPLRETQEEKKRRLVKNKKCQFTKVEWCHPASARTAARRQQEKSLSPCFCSCGCGFESSRVSFFNLQVMQDWKKKKERCEYLSKFTQKMMYDALEVNIELLEK